MSLANGYWRADGPGSGGSCSASRRCQPAELSWGVAEFPSVSWLVDGSVGGLLRWGGFCLFVVVPCRWLWRQLIRSRTRMAPTSRPSPSISRPTTTTSSQRTRRSSPTTWTRWSSVARSSWSRTTTWSQIPTRRLSEGAAALPSRSRRRPLPGPWCHRRDLVGGHQSRRTRSPRHLLPRGQHLQWLGRRGAARRRRRSQRRILRRQLKAQSLREAGGGRRRWSRPLRRWELELKLGSVKARKIVSFFLPPPFSGINYFTFVLNLLIVISANHVVCNFS